MIKLLGKIPEYLTVAVSGGIDSMTLVDFLSKKHDVTMAFFHHGTETSDRALEFLIQYSEEKNLALIFDHIKAERDPTESQEEFWRKSRYEFLDRIPGPVATAHHLDDCVETWIWSSLHGCPKLIPYERNNVFRPLLLTPKKDLEKWCVKNSVPWIEDSSNVNTKFTRNYIRHELMPHALAVNPGLPKMIRKKLVSRQSAD
jgi:tRNA(Ile)-lysidine synthase